MSGKVGVNTHGYLGYISFVSTLLRKCEILHEIEQLLRNELNIKYSTKHVFNNIFVTPI